MNPSREITEKTMDAEQIICRTLSNLIFV